VAVKIVLTNGAQASDVFWQVGRFANFYGDSDVKMVGTVIAAIYIESHSSVQVEGRLISLDGLYLDNNTIVFPFPAS
jgi:hypothetical protein